MLGLPCGWKESGFVIGVRWAIQNSNLYRGDPKRRKLGPIDAIMVPELEVNESENGIAFQEGQKEGLAGPGLLAASVTG